MKQYTKPSSDIGTRFMGVIFFLGSAILGYMHILSPLMKAASGELNISYSTKAVLFAPLGILLSLYLIVFGGKGLDKPPSDVVIYTMIAFAVIVIAVCFFGMQYIMKSLGYS